MLIKTPGRKRKKKWKATHLKTWELCVFGLQHCTRIWILIAVLLLFAHQPATMGDCEITGFMFFR